MEQKTLSSMMEEKRVFHPPAELSKKAYIKSLKQYREIYQRSIKDPEAFWAECAQQLDWYKKWDKVLVEDFTEARHEWFVGGKLNVAHNCLDRHLQGWRRNKAALIWEGDIGDSKTLTYQQLYHQVCRFANVLKKHGVKKGDRVSIYLPMILELP
ncbi:MAG: acetyl-coenzyme A synthetase, partial [Dehalococcoidia bacterium]